jgi:hypothetical protein
VVSRDEVLHSVAHALHHSEQSQASSPEVYKKKASSSGFHTK